MAASVSLVAALTVAGGGALGALARWAVGLVCVALVGHGFPWATLVVNLVGSFVMGLAAGWLAHAAVEPMHGFKLFVMTGFLGAFTTFSAFSLDFMTLWQRGDWALAGVYGAGSVLLGVLALVAGMLIVRSIV